MSFQTSAATDPSEVIVREPLDQISDTKVPKEVKVLEGESQTAKAMVEVDTEATCLPMVPSLVKVDDKTFQTSAGGAMTPCLGRLRPATKCLCAPSARPCNPAL